MSLICFAEVEITPGYFWGTGQISKNIYIYKLDHCVFLTIEAQLDDAIGHGLGKKMSGTSLRALVWVKWRWWDPQKDVQVKRTC